jgi:hypothetical protein
MSSDPSWELAGTYLEACNCQAICPWRTIDGKPGQGDPASSSLHRVASSTRAVPIEVDHTPGRGWFRGGGQVSVRIRAPVEEEATVTCVIPGHHRQGREVHADLIKVEDGELGFEVTGRCGYEATFAYSSSDE